MSKNTTFNIKYIAQIGNSLGEDAIVRYDDTYSSLK